MPDHAPSHPDEPNGHEGGALARTLVVATDDGGTTVAFLRKGVYATVNAKGEADGRSTHIMNCLSSKMVDA